MYVTGGVVVGEPVIVKCNFPPGTSPSQPVHGEYMRQHKTCSEEPV